MGSKFIAQFTGVAKTAAGDLFELIAPATYSLILHEVKITQSTESGDAQSEQITIAIKRATGTYTSGSGGTTPTAVPLNFLGAAYTGTVEANNTTPASAGTGVLATLLSISEHVQLGLHYLPTPELRFECGGANAFVVSLVSTPADSITFDGYIIFEVVG